jgi:hypothetical protein
MISPRPVGLAKKSAFQNAVNSLWVVETVRLTPNPEFDLTQPAQRRRIHSS